MERCVRAGDFIFRETENSTKKIDKIVFDYIEGHLLLDEYERNDCIYIVRNRDGIYAENLSLILKRNDIKKSEAYQSGFLEGTTPMYESYMRLKKSIANSI